MKLYREKELCCGCGACMDACPVDAVRMTEDGEGFFYPQADAAACIRCGRCEAVCPMGREEAAPDNRYFGARAREGRVRLASSSGGVFPVLAEYVLRRRGAVFGAAFGEGMEAAHREAWSLEELEGLKTTKYIQSRMDGVYRRVRALLEEGRQVLFCGTPCQAHALRRFLGGPCDGLITADLVCFGVPSPGIWTDYVKFLERRHGGALTAFSFRDKRARDNGHTRAYVCAGKEYAGDLGGDPYCGMFFGGYIIRPSCHACRYCTTDRGSDFTLGDFWGIGKVRPEADDGMGNSLVMLHTEKARGVWAEVREELDWFSCEEKDLLQPRLMGPTPAARGRGGFMALRRVLPAAALFPLFECARRAAGLLRRTGGGER